jgi:hypothetical protein
MPITRAQRLVSKWRIFKYNFQWSNYVWLFENRISKYTILVPVLGYLVLFNDQIFEHLKFQELADEGPIHFGVNPKSRLRMIYLGLLLIATAQTLYFLFRPSVLKFSSDLRGYVDHGLKYFTFSDFLNLHDKIRFSGSGPVTGYGDYYDTEWESFKTIALGNEIKRKKFQGVPVNDAANWQRAREMHEDLLKAILKESFAVRDRRHRLILCITLTIAFIGYALLLIPSLDLTLKVLSAIWHDTFAVLKVQMQ